MARYCFYCGRELEENEKCRCRERSFASSKSFTSTASQQTASPGGNTAPPPDRSQLRNRHKAKVGQQQTLPVAASVPLVLHGLNGALIIALERSKTTAKARQAQQQSQYSYSTPPYQQNTAQRRRATRNNVLSGFVRFFATRHFT